MDKRSELRRLFKDLAGVEDIVFPAVVESVNEEAQTVDVLPISSESILSDVRLKASVNEEPDGLVIFPEVGSDVLVAIIGNDKDEAFVCSFSRIASMKAKIGETTFEISQGEILINGGSLGGLIKIETLLERINRLEERMGTHQHLCASPGSPTTPDPATNAPFNQTQRSELENEKVKH